MLLISNSKVRNNSKDPNFNRLTESKRGISILDELGNEGTWH